MKIYCIPVKNKEDDRMSYLKTVVSTRIGMKVNSLSSFFIVFGKTYGNIVYLSHRLQIQFFIIQNCTTTKNLLK